MEKQLKDDLTLRINIVKSLSEYLKNYKPSPEKSRASHNLQKLAYIGEFIRDNDLSIEDVSEYKLLLSEYKDFVFLKNIPSLEAQEEFEKKINDLEKKYLTDYHMPKRKNTGSSKILDFSSYKEKKDSETIKLDLDGFAYDDTPVITLESYKFRKELLKKINVVVSGTQFLQNELILVPKNAKPSEGFSKVFYDAYLQLDSLCKKIKFAITNTEQINSEDYNIIDNFIKELYEVYQTLRSYLNKKELKKYQNCSFDKASFIFSNIMSKYNDIEEKVDAFIINNTDTHDRTNKI